MLKRFDKAIKQKRRTEAEAQNNIDFRPWRADAKVSELQLSPRQSLDTLKWYSYDGTMMATFIFTVDT